MDEKTKRNRILEEQYPEGSVGSGFFYGFKSLNNPPNTIAFEINMTDGNTLRLFFEYAHFLDFAKVVNVVVKDIIVKSSE